jgi:cytochrome c553
MKSPLILSLLAVAFISGCGDVSAKTPEELGEERAKVCSGCHGGNGEANIPIYPNLAGQNAPYLELTLKAYRDQTRTGVNASAMYAMAANLSDDDIKNIAAYYSSLAK